MTEKDIETHAASDAKFDGYDWIGMSNTAKARYTERVRRGYDAVRDSKTEGA
jgi:hypothetical protein